MRPFAESVVASLRENLPHLRFRLRPQRLEPSMNLVWVQEPLPPGVTQAEVDVMIAITDSVNADLTTVLDAYPRVAEALSPADIARVRSLASIVLRDETSVMIALDRVLLTLDSLASVTGLDFLIHLAHQERACGGTVWQVPEDGPLVGFTIKVTVPVSLSMLAHEAAHVLHLLRGDASDDHGPRYISDLRQVLELLDSTGCGEAVGSALRDVLPPEIRPGIVNAGRWRMAREDGDFYALWRADDASNWGSGAEDGVSRITLKDDGIAFVRRCLGKDT